MLNCRVYFILTIIQIILFFLKSTCYGNNTKPLPPSIKGFGPYYIATRSIEKCDIGSTLDEGNVMSLNIKVNKVSRTDEEFIGNATVPNDIQVTKGIIQYQKWQDGGFRTELKKVFEDPCNLFGYSIILKKNFKPDKHCKIKKGVYKIEGPNPNEIMHLMFQSFHYNRYLFLLEWHTKRGSLGCFQVMCEVKPLKMPKKRKN